MTSSETIAALAAALAEAQGELTPVAFDRDNPFFHSRYATLTALREAMRPVFARHGLSVIQGAGVDGGIETTILHSSGEWLTSAGLPMKPVKDDPQGIGSLITYARRYGLAAAAGLVADEDDDAEGATHGKAPQSPQDASTPRSDVRHPEPANPVNAEGSGVNAGASQKHGSPCAVYGQVKGAIYPEEKRGKDGKVYHVASFDLLIPANANGGAVYHVTAWHDAADVAETLQDGEWVDITGTWNVWQGRVKINANSITFQQQTQQPAVDTTTDDEIPF